jgi:hypothetical protein
LTGRFEKAASFSLEEILRILEEASRISEETSRIRKKSSPHFLSIPGSF